MARTLTSRVHWGCRCVARVTGREGGACTATRGEGVAPCPPGNVVGVEPWMPSSAVGIGGLRTCRGKFVVGLMTGRGAGMASRTPPTELSAGGRGRAAPGCRMVPWVGGRTDGGREIEGRCAGKTLRAPKGTSGGTNGGGCDALR